MEYEEIRELKRSEKNIVHLLREKDTGQLFVRKILNGQNEVYSVLQSNPHPFLPKLYEVTVSDTSTTVIEEYIEDMLPAPAELSEKQFCSIVRDLCCVLEFLHGKGIIHRDIKPSNILMARDGHIRLIDFDAARMHKDRQEQDTSLLGTKGYAPPEQYGFAQTDERSDIYSLGMTLEQLLCQGTGKTGYRRVIRKCTRLDPDKRYQSVRQVRRAFFQRKWNVLYGILALLPAIFLWKMVPYLSVQQEDVFAENTGFQVLPAPENPRWDGETGIGLWGNVPESGVANGNGVKYKWKLCRRDTADPPGPEESVWELEGDMSGNIWSDVDGVPTFDVNFSMEFWENGFYYFAVAAEGDGVFYTDSPYVVSDAFEYRGEDAPLLPVPTGLAWSIVNTDKGWVYYATWDNLEDYEDADSFDVTVYDKNNEYVTNNIWTKEYIMNDGYGGIRIRPEFMTQKDGAYRFTVQVQTSRPNEFKSSFLPTPVTEEYFSPWYYY